MKCIAITIALMFAPSCPTLAAPEGDLSYHYQGHVLSAKDQNLMLMVGSESIEFIVAPEAQVRIDGVAGSLEQLRPGFLASVEANRLGNRLVAQRIDAKSAMIASHSQATQPDL